jgi:hypothetical protein
MNAPDRSLMVAASRHDLLMALRDRLNDACVLSDWEALAAIDREIARLLPRWRDEGRWTAAEQLGLERLRQSHRAALELCQRSSDELAVRLSDLGMHKDGWLAYAVDGSWEEVRP